MMRSRPARLTLSALAWIALGAAAFFIVHAQQQIDQRRSALRAFESSARDAADALDDVQAGQQAYVATGQDAGEWMPKVATFMQTASSTIDTLRASAQAPAAGPALLEASTAMTQAGNIDRRVRDALASEDAQGAADVVFAEGADVISSAVSNVDAALTAEQQGADTFEAERRRAQVYAAGGAAGLVAIILVMLAFATPAGAAADAAGDLQERADPSAAFSRLAHDPVANRTEPAPPAPAEAMPPGPSATDSLRTVAALCTDFGTVRDADQLKVLLQRCAEALNARGLVVWLGSAVGSDLRPVLAHGYSDATLARLSSVPRTADNAAAAAYRTGELQIVKSRPGAAQGAIVAPLLAPDGCIGALSAEIRDRGEESEAVRAMSAILAAQLAGVLAAAADGGAAAADGSDAAADSGAAADRGTAAGSGAAADSGAAAAHNAIAADESPARSAAG